MVIETVKVQVAFGRYVSLTLCCLTLFCSPILALEAKIKSHIGSPTIFVNGEPITPLMLYSYAESSFGKTQFVVEQNWKPYEIMFIAPRQDNNCSVEIIMEKIPGCIWLDSVQLHDHGDSNVKNSSKLGNWELLNEDTIKAWDLSSNPSDKIAAELSLDGSTSISGKRSCMISIASGSNLKETLILSKTGLTIEKGHRYTFTIWMKADCPRIISVGVLSNGEPRVYYSLNRDSNFVQQAKKAMAQGVHTYSFSMRLPWPKPGSDADFFSIDRVFSAVLSVDRKAMMLPRFGLDPPDWWKQSHPTEMMVFSDSSQTQSKNFVSVASELWRKEAISRLKGLIRHCETEFGNSVLGYHPCGQHTAEWFYKRAWEPVHNGFENVMRIGFEKWLCKKYGNIQKLREAWNDNSLQFHTICTPTVEDREKTEDGLFRNPAKEYPIIDFHEYQQNAICEFLEQVAHTIKQETEGKKLVALFYGYIFTLSDLPKGPQNSGHLALQRLLKCPDVDILASPVDYRDRQIGGCGFFMAPVDSVRDAGKLWLVEDDARTHMCPPHSWVIPVGRVNNPIHSQWIHQRNFSHLLPRRLASWYMDLTNEGWLNSDILWYNLGKLKDIYDNDISNPTCWNPDVAIIVDEKSLLFLADNRTLTSPLLSCFREDYYRMGTNFRINFLDDVLSDRIKLPKVTLFLGCFHLDTLERKKLKEALAGKTALWFYGSGYLNEEGSSVKNIEQLTGFSFEEIPGGCPPVLSFTREHPVTAGITEKYGPKTVFQPIWSIHNTAGIIPLAYYENGSMSAALKDCENWRSIYIGSTGCSAKMLRNILRLSGVHVYIDSDDLVVTDGSFLSVTASNTGTKKLLIPEGKQLYEIGNQTPLTFSSDNIVTVDFEQGQTRMYLLKPPL